MDIIKPNNPFFSDYWNKLGDNKIEGTLYSPLNIKYSTEYANQSSFKDYSFIITENETPIITVIISLETTPEDKKVLSGFGRSICYIESDQVDSNLLKKVRKLFSSEFDNILKETAPNSIFYQDYLNNSALSFLGNYLMDMGATANPYFTRMQNLSQPEEQLRQQLRKSYKSLVNWGSKNLNLRLLDSKTISLKDMEAFRQLHIQVARRETRSAKSWEIQYETVKNNEGFIVLGYLEKELVTAGYFIQNSVSCYYGVGASIRELFDKPLLHSVIWQAITHAKKQGCSFFETGEQLYSNFGSPTSKELGISKFKRGFGGETKTRLNINWSK